MDYRILYPEAFPVVELKLNNGESIKAESDSMIAMTSNIEIEGKMEGGLFKGLMRKVLTDESLFLQRLTARGGEGRAVIGHALPGGIRDVQLNGGPGLIVQKGGFLAATEGIDVDSKMQSISRGLFSGEGFFLVKVSGRGIVFISSYGMIHPISLSPGKEIIVDNSHLVAWDENMTYNIDKASKGIIDSLTSGEGLVCRFRGPGTVYIQTRNPESFSSWIRSMIPPAPAK